ncbi:metallophosphoesterase [Vibrio sp. 10N.222.54.B12]|uniref:metallophosphoesterase n=1 Tax=unclassified Vibrio TaxID=2614977 RepID=UPI0035503F02
MAMIESKHIDALFTDLSQYGLRGNSALWAMLKEALNETEKQFTGEQLIEWVLNFTRENMFTSLVNEIENCTGYPTNWNILSEYGYQENFNNSLEQIGAGGKSVECCEWLTEFVEKILANDDMDTDLYIEAFNRGGMSGGGFQLGCWKMDMLPTLISRIRQLEEGLKFRANHNLDEMLFIGDVHGQVEKLDELLSHYCWQEGDAKLIFVGDLIDNSLESGAEHLALLNKVKQWVDDGHALCLLGNHEFNAIGWLLTDDKRNFCRDRTKPGNIKQHQLFIKQVGEDSAEHKKWVEWFKQLPLFLNFGDMTAIHACWHDQSIQRLRPYLNDDNSLKEEHWYDAFNTEHELYQLIEILLKGPEVTLPKGSSFLDKNGIERSQIRVAWWKNVYSVDNYQDLAVVSKEQRERIPTIKLAKGAKKYNQAPLVPVVIGHYTLEPTLFPQVLSSKVICVDFNAAKNEYPLVSLPTWSDFSENIQENTEFCFVGEPAPSRIVSCGIMSMLDDKVNSLPKRIQSSEFETYVSKVLLEEWDPIGVHDPDYFDEDLSDEYSDYEECVNRLAQAGDIGSLAAYLILTEQHVIGLERQNAEYQCSKVAYDLVNKWIEMEDKN